MDAKPAQSVGLTEGQKGLTNPEGGLGGSGVKNASGGCRTRVPDQRNDGQDGQAAGEDIHTSILRDMPGRSLVVLVRRVAGSLAD